MTKTGPKPRPDHHLAFMTLEEFTVLPSVVQHAVWKAADEGRLEFFLVHAAGSRRYHRQQVRALLATLTLTERAS